MKKYLPFLFLFFLSLVFFWKFFINGLIPVPSDTIVGLYHPYRDLYAKDYPRGIPFKNFLITDPVRQIYPWKELAISQFKNYSIPIWNPYEMAGRPLLANFQSAVFYPFNILFFIVPFWLSWSFLIMIQPLLGSIFMFLFLRNLKLDIFSSFFGGVVFAFSGFFVTWLEWGNVLHTALWLPLILLSIDKIFQHSKEISNIKNKKFFVWFGILLFSSLASFFGGHLQIFFYVSIVTALYFIFRLYKQSKKFNILFVFLIFSILFLILTSIQWIPTLQFVLLSARGLDQGFLDVEGWFIPWQHLVQFIAPDFFGNPTTLNYWGTWNYGELTGYFGIIPLLFAIFAIFIKKNKEVLFFAFVAILALIFALPTPLAKIPFLLNLPLISTSQPTRLLFLVNFSLAVLSAFGLNYYSNILKNIRIGEKKLVLFSLGLVGIGIAALYVFTIVGIKSGIDPTNLAVAKRNSILPLAIFIASLVLILGSMRINKKFTNVILALLILITIFDLFRFSWKFNTFSKKEYLFPSTKSIEYLKKDKEIFRVASNDSRILAPNFLTHYKIQTIEGYDPLYLLSYGELIAATERGEPNITPPFGFNRIITPHNLNSKIIDFLNVKYIFSLTDIQSQKFEMIHEEGQTKIFKNQNYHPRTFFVKKLVVAKDKKERINEIFKQDLSEFAVVEEEVYDSSALSIGSAEIIKYNENEVIIKTENQGTGFLVLSDAYYPTWRAFMDGREQKIYKTNHAFRGVVVPSGSHELLFKNNML